MLSSLAKAVANPKMRQLILMIERQNAAMLGRRDEGGGGEGGGGEGGAAVMAATARAEAIVSAARHDRPACLRRSFGSSHADRTIV